MKKTVCLLLALVLVAGCLAGCGKKDDSSINVGFLVHITGDSALWGQAERDGAQIAVDEINAAGGVLGKTLNLTFYDGRSTSADSLNAVKKAVQQDKVCVMLGSNMSGPTIAVADVCAKAKVPQVATFATNTLVTQDENGKLRDWSFRICFTDPYQGKIIANYAYNTLNVTDACILYDITSDYSVGIMNEIQNNFKALGGEIKGVYSYKSGDVDFRSQLTNIKTDNPQAILVPNLYKDNSLIAKQAYELGIDVPLIAGDSYSAAMFEICPDLHDYYTVNHFDWSDPALSEIRQKYVDRFKEESPELNVVMGYDCVYFLKACLESAGSTEPEAIRSAIEHASDIALTHATITIDPQTHNPLNKDAVILGLGNGETTFVGRFTPEN